jgi:hypothetical protein
MQETTTWATAEQLLEHIQRSYAMHMGRQIGPLNEYFIIDQSLPSTVVEHGVLELGLTLEEVNAALECWRSKMVEAVDTVAADYMAIAKKFCR